MKINIKTDIIIPAWELIKDDSKIKKMQFLPGILSIIFLSALLAYQTIYTYVKLSHTEEKTLKKILNFIHSGYLTEFLIGFGIFVFLYIILMPIFEGALIKYIELKDNSKKHLIGESISFGFYKFLPIFEYNNMFSEFKFLSIVNFYLFMLRFFDFNYIKIINYSFLIILIFSIIINILFSYSKYFIVIENKKVFSSIGESIKLALLNVINTTKLYLIMFILNIRVIFNFILFLIFPVIIVSVLGFLTSQTLKTIALIGLISLFILFLLLLGYLAGVLEALKTAIWYFAYKKARQRLNIIEQELKKD